MDCFDPVTQVTGFFVLGRFVDFQKQQVSAHAGTALRLIGLFFRWQL